MIIDFDKREFTAANVISPMLNNKRPCRCQRTECIYWVFRSDYVCIVNDLELIRVVNLKYLHVIQPTMSYRTNFKTRLCPCLQLTQVNKSEIVFPFRFTFTKTQMNIHSVTFTIFSIYRSHLWNISDYMWLLFTRYAKNNLMAEQMSGS